MKDQIVSMLEIYNAKKTTQRKYNQSIKMSGIIKDAFIISFDSSHFYGLENSVNLHFAFIADTNKIYITHPFIFNSIKNRAYSDIDEVFEDREQYECVHGLPGFVEVINYRTEEEAFQNSLLLPTSTVVLVNDKNFNEIINYFWDL